MLSIGNRCLNFDWLELFLYEPNPIGEPRDEYYFTRAGFVVRPREYGTRVYRQMFTLYEGEAPVCEIRREPCSPRSQGGILDDAACSLRLVNRMCYSNNAIGWLRSFILAHGFTYRRISRLDLCLDFNTFDWGRRVPNFIQSYVKGRFTKLNQSRLCAHGEDVWSRREWNSLKWGSFTSSVQTKLYNKSKELSEVKEKAYIRQAWKAAGLDVKADVWRLEFSLTSQIRGFRREDSGEIVPFSLLTFDSPERCWGVFLSLVHRYFHFKKYIKDKRKDRCPDVKLFSQIVADPLQPVATFEPIHATEFDKMFVRRIASIAERSLELDLREHARYVLAVYAYRFNNAYALNVCEWLGVLPSIFEEKKQIRDEKGYCGTVEPQLNFQF